jgi:hypothetical protein
MIELKIDYKDINAQQLDGELNAGIPDKVFGLSTYGPDRQISVWMDDSATPADQQTAADLVAAHVPEVPIIEQPSLEQQIADLQAQLDQVAQAVTASTRSVK